MSAASSASSSSSASSGPFAAREPLFVHGDLTLRLLLPRSADELIDEDAFARDERLPYWADLWPSARALARYLLDHLPAEIHAAPVGSGVESGTACEEQGRPKIIELGCGAAALASLVLAMRGAHVLATDYEPEALGIVRANAQRHNASATSRGPGGGLRTRLLDWRDPPGDLGTFDLILGADLMYEQRNAIALADFVDQAIATSGKMLLADPGRRYLSEFQSRMRQRGFIERELAVIEEANDDSSKPPSRVRILEYSRAR